LQSVFEVRAHPSNTSRRELVALALLLVASASGGLSACGGAGSPNPQTLLSQTFQPRRPIESGRLELSLALSPTAPGTARSSPEAFSLGAEGSFQDLGSGRLPRFTLQLSVRAPALTLQLGATSTAGRFFIELAGKQFFAPASTVAALEQGYAQAKSASAAAQRQSIFAGLGLDPGRWLLHPTIAGTATIAGVETTHIVAGLDSAHLLAEVERLSASGGPLALGALGAGGTAALFSPARLTALSSSVRSARVDVYIGTRDHLLRRLAITAALLPSSKARAAPGGLRGESFTLALQLTALNQPQAIVAPSNPRPTSQLVAALARLGLLPRG
jgi:hypothetical protein